MNLQFSVPLTFFGTGPVNPNVINENGRTLGYQMASWEEDTGDGGGALNLIQKYSHGSPNLCQNVSMEPSFPTCEVNSQALCCHRSPSGRKKKNHFA